METENKNLGNNSPLGSVLENAQIPKDPASIQTQATVSDLIKPNPQDKKNGKKVLFILFILVLILSILLVGGFYFVTRNGNATLEKEAVMPTPTIASQALLPTSDPTSDWEIYEHAEFSVKYPSDLTVQDVEDNIFNLSIWGPTQTEGTELFDGFSVTFQSLDKQDMTAMEYAKDKISEAQVQGISEITEGPLPITINGYNGVTYTEEGLGTFKQIILESDNVSVFILISVMVSDPGNLGFQDTVDEILSTFEFTSASEE